MRLDYQQISELPKLGWVAMVDPARDVVSVLHGRAVECRKDWLVEGVWDGPFERGEFHRSENFFGSGLVVEGSRVYGVASSALVDRLIYGVLQGHLVISNSAILLAGVTGGRLDPNHDYSEETWAVLAGVKQYRRDFRIVHPEIDRFYQVYHENLVWEGGQTRFELRSQVREFHTFEEYAGRLRTALRAIRANYESPARRTPVVAFTTLSSGYDSTAVSALVRDIGVRTCFTSRRSSSAIPPWVSRSFSLDDGRPTARALGLEAVELDSRPSSISTDELYFLAVSVATPELVFHSMAQHIERECSAAVVFTGHWGGQLWKLRAEGKELDDSVRRGDPGGLNLSEIRLKSGFIQIPAAFLFARSATSINRISRSPEMEPWRLHSSYDKPIPRRIAETAGIPRGLFGTRKKAAMRYYAFPRNRVLRKQFLNFLRRTQGVRPSALYVAKALDRLRYLSTRAWDYAWHAYRIRKLSDPMFAQDLHTRASVGGTGLRTEYLMYGWAFGLLSESVGKQLRDCWQREGLEDGFPWAVISRADRDPRVTVHPPL